MMIDAQIKSVGCGAAVLEVVLGTFVTFSKNFWICDWRRLNLIFDLRESLKIENRTKIVQ
jgi:hypothetical protein